MSIPFALRYRRAGLRYRSPGERNPGFDPQPERKHCPSIPQGERFFADRPKSLRAASRRSIQVFELVPDIAETIEMNLLISARTVDEALLAAESGANFIDLKEPHHGALGALPLVTIRACVAALRGCGLPVSATIGDAPQDIGDGVQRVADCGVDLVKVGIARNAAAADVLAMLATCGRRVVPVLLADRGLDAALVTQAASLGFAGLMVDTADKRAGSLFDCVTLSELKHFIECARGASMMCGLAGALRLEHLPQLTALEPDFAGFRSAVCTATAAQLSTPSLRALRQAASGGLTSPSSNDRIESSALL